MEEDFNEDDEFFDEDIEEPYAIIDASDPIGRAFVAQHGLVSLTPFERRALVEQEYLSNIHESLSDENEDAIMECVALGIAPARICNQLKVRYVDLMAWIRKSDVRYNRYQMAREDSAELMDISSVDVLKHKPETPHELNWRQAQSKAMQNVAKRFKPPKQEEAPINAMQVIVMGGDASGIIATQGTIDDVVPTEKESGYTLTIEEDVEDVEDVEDAEFTEVDDPFNFLGEDDENA